MLRTASVIAATVGTLVLLSATSSADAAQPPHDVDGRRYEMVSPAEKNGYPIYFSFQNQNALGLTKLSRDGDSAVFVSFGSFAGALSGMPTTYKADRRSTGWTTKALTPPPVTLSPNAFTTSSTWIDTSADLSIGAINTEDFFDPTDINRRRDVYLQALDAQPVLVSRGDGAIRTDQPALFEGLSSDGTVVAFSTASHLTPADADRGEGQDVYLRVRGRTKLLNVDSGGGLLSRCGSTLGGGGTRVLERAISDDGSQVVFQTPNPTAFIDPSCFEPRRVYVWTEAQTFHASASRRAVPDPDGTRAATYAGASVDGSTVVFSSEEMLTDAASPGGGLYSFHPDARGGALEFLEGTRGAAPVAVSDDGTRVFFVSTNQVVPGEGEAGRENLYVSVNGTVRWIATNRSDTDGAALVSGIANPDQTARQAYVTADGRHLVFATSADLVGFDNTDANGAARQQVYVYSDARDELLCLSCDPAGQRPADSTVRSDALLSDAHRYLPTASGPETTASDDGAIVAFTTGDRLVPHDTNQRRDVYVHRAGRLQLISSGRSSADSYLVGVSASGRDVFFGTVDALVSDDRDGGNLDIYNARIGGGFPPSDEPEGPACQGDACQGSARPAPWLAPVGSAGVSGTGQALDEPSRTRPRVRLRVPRRVVRGRRFTVVVKVPAAGRVVVSGPRVRKQTRSIGRSGAVRVRVTLKRRVQWLRQRRGVRVRVRVAFRPVDARGPSSTATAVVKMRRTR